MRAILYIGMAILRVAHIVLSSPLTRNSLREAHYDIPGVLLGSNQR